MQCKNKIQLKSGEIVPCGRCPICKANQRQEWVFRLREEQRESAFSLFVTLTYDDEHVPKDYSVNKRDVQLFFKRLRKRVCSFRYYFVSEYGDNTFRPHYHGLFFFSQIPNINQIYDNISFSWQNGFCSFGQVEEGSIVYCTKYCLKKNNVPFGRKDNFRLVSKMNGGLGYQYLNKMVEYHRTTQNLSFVASNGQKCRMPKYYKDKIKGLIRSDFPDFDLEQRELSSKRSSLEHLQGFKDFIRGKHFDSLEAAETAFNAEKIARGVRENDLIIRHTKKQKF